MNPSHDAQESAGLRDKQLHVFPKSKPGLAAEHRRKAGGIQREEFGERGRQSLVLLAGRVLAHRGQDGGHQRLNAVGFGAEQREERVSRSVQTIPDGVVKHHLTVAKQRIGH